MHISPLPTWRSLLGGSTAWQCFQPILIQTIFNRITSNFTPIHVNPRLKRHWGVGSVIFSLVKSILTRVPQGKIDRRCAHRVMAISKPTFIQPCPNNNSILESNCRELHFFHLRLILNSLNKLTNQHHAFPLLPKQFY